MKLKCKIYWQSYDVYISGYISWEIIFENKNVSFEHKNAIFEHKRGQPHSSDKYLKWNIGYLLWFDNYILYCE